MNGDDSDDKEFPDEEKEVEDGDVSEGQNLFKEENLKGDGFDGDGTDGQRSGLEGQGGLQVQQQQAQGTASGWERFLPVRSIKVLLVENDDSTRHVVTALLRNCNYEVIEASNGLQAWKILEDLTNHVDLVLTEVVMPVLSGIGLLYKIMSHKTRKNIPVIMMSSHDSMGLVFKCLSKGAVDFLVKPIRKNELKNLWQHVWRRCHSSSGSGSESGTHTQKSIKSKSSEKSENNSGSNNGEDSRSSGNGGDGSDDGSGTQSSWTKQPIEVESSQALAPVDQVADCPDSTCAQVVHSNTEASAYKRVQMTATRNFKEEQKPEGNDLNSGQPLDAKPGNPLEEPVEDISGKKLIPLETDPGTSSKKKDKGHEYHSSECPTNKHNVVCGAISDAQPKSKEFDASRELLNRKSNTSNDSNEPATELSLKLLRGVLDSGKGVQEDQNILRHSELSAFSRYNASSNAFRTPNGITGSSSVIDNSQEVARKVSTVDTHNHLKENPPHPSLKGVSNDIDMGSTTNKLPTSPLMFMSEATSTINGLHPSSAFKPVKNEVRCNPQQVTVVKPSDVQSTALLNPAIGPHQDLQIHHTHHHLHHHHHHYHHRHRNSNHFHSFEQLHTISNNDETRKLAADAPNCGSSRVLGRPSGEIPLNYSLNRSASGSNYVSNGHNGSSRAVNAGGTNGESDIGLPLQSGSGDANGSGSGNRIDPNRLVQREAALTKFRQKRKERCFKKKVRYQNRKRLAELRPRVRGQFVRQTGQESSNNETSE